jgi:hypothetical protein
MGLSARTDVVHGRDRQRDVQLLSGFPVRATPSHHTTALVLSLFLSAPVAMADCTKVIELLYRLCS